ncbi:MAG: hypothetical protein K8S56_08225 [Candidatus Cloacimonetes bacterium]|nr:hypothetical protein [Candidatus Cloacimonadota bacterium]
MQKKKVITNYTIENKNTVNIPQQIAKIPKIIKQAQITPEDVEVNPGADVEQVLQPVIDVTKNEMGVITSIKVTCSCGETLTILLDYE